LNRILYTYRKVLSTLHRESLDLLITYTF